MKTNKQCPRWLIALIKDLDEELARCYWNKYQKKWISPLQNTGVKYENSVFELKGYDWSDEERPYNFKFGHFEVSWYKHIGRCTEMNREIDADEFIYMYEECLKSVLEDFKKEEE